MGIEEDLGILEAIENEIVSIRINFLEKCKFLESQMTLRLEASVIGVIPWCSDLLGSI